MATKKAGNAPLPDLQRLEVTAELYLQDCFARLDRVRVSDYARFLGLARPYLSRRVKELTGESLTGFLRTRQLAYAQELLRSTPLSVEQIAFASAFGSEWTFRRHFKAAFGLTPADYRLRNVSRAYVLTVTPR